MQHININNINFSKIICGTNSIYGRSHFSEARDIEYKNRFNDQTTLSILHHCCKSGINTIESSANEKITSMISTLKKETQDNINFIGSTRIDHTSPIKSHNKKLESLINNRSEACIIHAQIVDNITDDNGFKTLERMINKIKKAELISGISTHKVKTVEMCERKGLDIDLYLFPLNLTGFVYPGYKGNETVQERINIVKNIKKPFVLMKVLGAGRIPPDEGMQFIAENSKKNDLITIGFSSGEEVSEIINYTDKYL
jgi:hypothetical protein